MINLLYAKPVREKVIEMLKNDVHELGFSPLIKIIVAEGFNDASKVYVGHKISDCENIGVKADIDTLNWREQNKEIVLNEIISKLRKYNEDDSVTGYIVQLSLPYGITENDFVKYIDSKKDLDGFTSQNLGDTFKKVPTSISPATPLGITMLLEHYGVDVCGKDVLVINRSQIVGIGLIPLLLERNATVTVAHSKTKNLEDKISRADVIVFGVGKKDFLANLDYVKDGAVLVDVSINVENGKLYGDVSKELYNSERNISITPVPGGVGITTRLALIYNIVKCAKMQSVYNIN